MLCHFDIVTCSGLDCQKVKFSSRNFILSSTWNEYNSNAEGPLPKILRFSTKGSKIMNMIFQTSIIIVLLNFRYSTRYWFYNVLVLHMGYLDITIFWYLTGCSLLATVPEATSLHPSPSRPFRWPSWYFILNIFAYFTLKTFRSFTFIFHPWDRPS